MNLSPFKSRFMSILFLIENCWAGVRLLVVGDVMLDKYAFGHVTRILLEAPVSAVQGDRTNEQPDGATNVAMNLAGVGVTALIAGFIGEDPDGLQLSYYLERESIESLLVTSPAIRITSKLRIIGASQKNCAS